MELYQPGKVNTNIQFPSEWNDLHLQELHLISKSILSDFKNEAQALAAIFMNILKMRCGKKVPGIENRLDAEDTVINGLPALEFLYKENTLTKQPYPVLDIARFSWLSFFKGGLAARKFIGPADDFNYLTCGEFEDAEIYYNNFKEDPSGEALANLAAILYRPEGSLYHAYDYKTARYIPYDSEKRVNYFLNLKPWELYTIYLWYCGCREQLPRLFPTCFEGDGSSPTDGPDYMVFTKCIHAGAGTKNGTRDQIRCTILKEFFMECELEKIKANELKEQYENANK